MKAQGGPSALEFPRRTGRSLPVALVTTFLAIILLVGGAGTVALLWFDNASVAREKEAESTLKHFVLGERLRADVESTVASSRGYLADGDPTSLEHARAAQRDVARGLRDLATEVQTPEGHRLLDRVAASADAYHGALEALLLAKSQGVASTEVTSRFDREIPSRRRELDAAVDAFLKHRNERLSNSLNASRRDEKVVFAIALTLLLSSILAAGVVSWKAARRLAAAYARLEEAERTARAANEAREQLLATVAHDLRNPLNAMTMKATLIQRSAVDEKTREHAAGIERVSARMEHLIKSLLDASVLEAGHLRVSKAPCDLSELLRETASLFAGVAASKSIGLEIPPPSAPVEVLADRERILQVLSNLVGNALQFTPEGGRIRISADRDNGMVRVSVADNGPGIAPEHIPHLFDRFWQAEGGMRRGAGLGLYISLGIVNAHGGRLWAESQLGHGATFHFTLPALERLDGNWVQIPDPRFETNRQGAEDARGT